VPVSYFLLFLCFRSDTQEIFSKLDKTSSWSLILPGSFQRSEGEKERGHQGPTRRGGAASPWPAPPWCETAWVLLWHRPFVFKDPPTEKPKYPITFPEHIAIRRRHRPEDREGPEALPGTLPERGIATGGLLHHYACLRSDEWVVYLGLWVHSSS
jgi:hypothetical protein